MSSKTYRRATADFAASTRAASRVLIIEIAGLGDLVHSLPAMWAVRQAYPHAELHCLTRKCDASLLRLTPWIDRVLPYSRGKLQQLRHHVDIARALRAQHYDVVINLVGSNYACTVGWITGADRHLVRRPGQLKPRRGWHLFGTDIVEQPFGQEPMYLQRCKALAQAGIETPTPEFRLNWEADTARQLGLHDAHRQGYIHLSPFARGIHKEMPLPQLAELLTRLHQWSPETRLAISCASNARERRALDELLAALPFQPWKIFSGTLDIPQLCALIQHAALHLSGDTGSMHLAWLLGTPSVSWFLRTGSTRQWAPVGAQHANVAVDVAQPPALWIDAIAAQAMRLLDPTEPIRPRTRRAGTFNKTPLPALPALPEYSFGK